jgi:hypothetical protein
MLKWRLFLKKTITAVCLIAALAVLAAPRLSAQSAGTLRDVTFSQADGKTVFLIKVDGEFSYETSMLTMPRRLVVDLTPVGKIAAAPYLQVNTAGVVSVRTGQFKPLTARVVFDLTDEDFVQNISASEGGLIVSFRLADKPAVRPAEKTPPVREIPREEIRQTSDETTPAGGADRLGFFIQAGAGLGVYFKPDLTARREFALYGETGAVDEAYKIKGTTVFEGRLGRYFHFGHSRLKTGLGFSVWKLPLEGSFTLTLPHPFRANDPRTVAFSETSALEQSGLSFYGFALFPLIDGEHFSVFLGPLLGYASSKILTLSDWDINEKSPFSSADVTVTNPVYAEDKISEFLIGASLSVEVSLGRSLALVLDTKVNYLNPKVTNLGKRANLLSIQPTLGIQFSF